MKTLFPHAKRPLLFGHRGYSELAPENTMAAFDLCVAHEIPGIEIDVHLCKTGELVVIHDHDLLRLAGVEHTVEEMSLTALKQLDVGSHKDKKFAGERIPLLEELFTTYAKKFYYDIELKVHGYKDTGIARKTWQTIQAHHLEEVCLVSSFNPFAIRYFNKVSHKAIPTAVIYSEAEAVPKVLRRGWGRHIARATVLKPDHKQVTEQMMDKFSTKKGFPIITWTVNNKEQGKKLLDLGVDGLISNDPKLFKTN
ncbi:MAG: glycerophosphodiester phosphodiesterase family protein [Sphaerochaetaceae bacterium]|nr:glycerophosphodiester phosphodiesterase family protein [Sphaerochaetaceae bacterium]